MQRHRADRPGHTRLNSKTLCNEACRAEWGPKRRRWRSSATPSAAQFEAPAWRTEPFLERHRQVATASEGLPALQQFSSLHA